MAQPTSAQAALEDEISDLEAEQSRVQEQRNDQTDRVDAATVEAEELATALKAVNQQVNALQAQIDSNEQKQIQLRSDNRRAVSDVKNLDSEIADLEVELSDRAIDGFKGGDAREGLPTFGGSTFSETAAYGKYEDTVNTNEVEASEALKETKVERQIAVDTGAQTEAELGQVSVELEEKQQALLARRDEQTKLAADAEDRLDAELAEAAVLEERDEELAQSIKEKNKPVAEQAQVAGTGGGDFQPVPVTSNGPPSGQIVAITAHDGQQIAVDSSIASNVQAMFNEANAQGLGLAGWGYRDTQRQVELRIQNCGGGQYNIYQKSSSACSPPTARPGRSQHERGLAIDITSNGSTIKSQRSAAFVWLQANASRYGLKNLPSEPWHWSTTGN